MAQSDVDVIEKFGTLPPEAQRQVLDFIAFLETRYQPVTTGKTKGKLADEQFIGIWQNRKDLSNSNAWVRTVRLGEWGSAK